MRSGSIQRRLVTRLVVLYLAALGLAIAIYFVDAVILRGVEMARPMENSIDAIVAAIHFDADGIPQLDAAEMERLRDGDPHFLAAVRGPRGGAPITHGDPEGLHISALLSTVSGEFSWGHSGIGRHGLVREVDTPAGHVAVLVVRTMQTLDVVQWIWHEIGEELMPFLLPLVLASLVVVPWTVRQTIVPLRVLGRRVAAIDPGSGAPGLPTDDLPEEVVPLIKAFDRAIDRLNTAFEQQRRFTANAAHELRTPLAVLRSRIESLPSAVDTSALQRDVDRMARLVAQLLAMARLEARQVAPQAGVDLAALAAEVVADLAPMAIAAGKTVTLERPRQPVRCRACAATLADALRNLVDNALRFTPPGGEVVVAVAEDGGMAVLDRGPGVAEALRRQVFEPFWRDSGRLGGTGLGLAIVAETAALHGGRAWVEPRPGGGAVFRLSLGPSAITD